MIERRSFVPRSWIMKLHNILEIEKSNRKVQFHKENNNELLLLIKATIIQ